MDQRHPLADSTLAELRKIVVAAQDMPAGSVVRVRTRYGASSDGALLKRVLIIAPEPLPDPGRRRGHQEGALFAADVPHDK